jgi:hypothetical protein
MKARVKRDLEIQTIVKMAFALAPGLTNVLVKAGLNGTDALKALFEGFGFTEEEQKVVCEETFRQALAATTLGMLDPEAVEIPLAQYVGVLLVEAARKGCPDSAEQAAHEVDQGVDGDAVKGIMRAKIKKYLAHPKFNGLCDEDVIDLAGQDQGLVRTEIVAVLEKMGKVRAPIEDVVIELFKAAEDKKNRVEECIQEHADVPVPKMDPDKPNRSNLN